MDYWSRKSKCFGSSQTRWTEFANRNKVSDEVVCTACTLSLYGQNTFNICNYEGKTLTTRAFFVENFSLAASNGFFMSII